MNVREIAERDQEQAVAAWRSYLNQEQIDRMINMLHDEFRAQDLDLGRATREMTKAMRGIDEVITKNDGGAKGLHGNIAEVAEAGVRNARSRVEGGPALFERLYDFSKDDLRQGDTYYQMKFSAAGGRFSLGAVRSHLDKYPSYISEGKKYIIPRDHYETVKRLYNMSEKEAARLSKSSGGPSYTDWKRVQSFFAQDDISFEDLEPSVHDYAEVQKGAIHDTMRRERTRLRETRNERRGRTRSDAQKIGSPSLQDGLKAAGSSAAIEGGAAFVMAIVSRLKGGKRLCDLGEDDWAEIASESGKGFAKGGVRGAAVYFATTFNVSNNVVGTYTLATHEFVSKAASNRVSMSGSAASALVTASFGVAEQAHRMREGSIDEGEFLERSELLCLDATVSALSSFLGQTAIPIPVLGAVIGNTVGNMLLQIAKDGLSERELALAEAYAEAQRRLDEELDARYQTIVAEVSEGMRQFLALLDRALAPDPAEAFEGSVALALSLGVPEEEALTTMDEIDDFFLL